MARRMKLAELDISETSGVDHPAHLHEGWLVIKQAGAETDTEGETVNLEVTAEDETVDIQTDAVDEAAPEAAPVAASVAGPDDALRKELTDLRKELAAMRVEKERIEAEAELAKATEDAHAWAVLPEMNPAEFAPMLIELRKSAPAAAAVVESVLTASARALGETGIFKEVGASGETDTVDAWAQVEARANDMVAAGEAPSFAKAVTLVAERDKDLYNRYITEKGL